MDLDIIYEANFLKEENLNNLFERIKNNSFNQEIFFDQSNFKMPRMIKWYGELPYAYANIYHPALTMPEYIVDILNKVNLYLSENYIDSQMNSVLINYYRDGKDKINYHSDDLTQIGFNPVITSVSLGETRTFSFKNKITKEKKNFSLHNGDLFVMKGETQEQWLHAVLPEKNKKERINLTFRNTLFQPRI